MKHYFFYFICLFLIISCKQEKEKEKENIDILYFILDKSSNSFSSNGGNEENFIEIDTSYLQQFITKLYYNQNRKSESVLFFSYIDKDAKGNKELFLKLPLIPTIDSGYVPEPGQIISSKKDFLKKIKDEKEKLKKQHKTFSVKMNQLLKELEMMLNKSERAKGSDCSGALTIADKKLNNYLIDTSKFNLNQKVIIAFSDLVNFPSKNDEINIKNQIIRPGYTSEVPYLDNDNLINITTQDEFEEFIEKKIKH